MVIKNGIVCAVTSPNSTDVGMGRSDNDSRIVYLSSARLGSDKYQFVSHWFDSTRVLIRARCSGRIGRVLVSHVGILGLNPWSSQTNDFSNWYLSFPSQMLGIIRIEQGLFGTM